MVISHIVLAGYIMVVGQIMLMANYKNYSTAARFDIKATLDFNSLLVSLLKEIVSLIFFSFNN